MTQTEPDTITCGDNIEIMRGMDSESIDLIYADPPFNSNRDYGAFDDKFGGLDAYIDWMVPRLQEMHRILKPTGSIYCHIDWHAVHYIKVEMDRIFGMKNFRNEIVWCYSGASSPKMKQFARKHDNILWYSKGESWEFNVDDVRLPYAKSSKNREGYRKTGFVGEDSDKCELNNKGKFPEDWWEIPFIRPNSKERLGYPTQKPEALLERIIKASSNDGDTVFDPFCGCGTTLAVAKRLGRNYIGIDINQDATDITNIRLKGVYQQCL